MTIWNKETSSGCLKWGLKGALKSKENQGKPLTIAGANANFETELTKYVHGLLTIRKLHYMLCLH
jgi:hypothetical protein